MYVYIYIYITEVYKWKSSSMKVQKWKVKKWRGEVVKRAKWNSDLWKSETVKGHMSQCEKVSRCKGETKKGEKGEKWKGAKVKKLKRWSGETCKVKQWPLEQWNSEKTHATVWKGVKVQRRNEERWKGENK